MNEAELADLRRQVANESSRLSEEFVGVYGIETIERFINEAWDSLMATNPRLPLFLPIFVRRFARERLMAAGQVSGTIARDRPEILFVCVHNAGRSQMAAVLTEHLSEGRVHVRSAGSAPAGEINPQVVAAMSELGLDLSQEFPKPLTDDFVRAADVVITMGCGDACPIYPGKRYADWEVSDPADETLDAVRAIRDDIAARVTELLVSLGVTPVAR